MYVSWYHYLKASQAKKALLEQKPASSALGRVDLGLKSGSEGHSFILSSP